MLMDLIIKNDIFGDSFFFFVEMAFLIVLDSTERSCIKPDTKFQQTSDLFCFYLFNIIKSSLKLPTLFSADKKNLFITQRFCMFSLSCEPTAYSFAVTPNDSLPITARLLL